MAELLSVAGLTKLGVQTWYHLLPKTGFSFLHKKNRTRVRYIKAMMASFGKLKDYGIEDPLDIAHFLAQGIIETGFLTSTSENLNYGAEALTKFKAYRTAPPLDPPRYKTVNGEKVLMTLADLHARKPKLIANTANGERMGNGDATTGDGWRYRGRGFIQLTGKNNYRKFSTPEIDLVADPDILDRDLAKSIEIAANFWKTNQISKYAKRGETSKVSRAVNRGDPNSSSKANHEDERDSLTQIVISFIQDPNKTFSMIDKSLEIGSEGPAVVAVQQALKALNKLSGKADGLFGRGTRAAVKSFQKDHSDLKNTGVVDAFTRQRLMQLVDMTVEEPTPEEPSPAQPAGSSESSSPPATPAPVPVSNGVRIGFGARGPEVKMVQLFLRKLGFDPGNIDSDFGNGVLGAVKAFQKSRNLPENGVVDGATLIGFIALIMERVSETALNKGDKGFLVRALQMCLIALGYNPGAPDGDFGEGTRGAVSAFQRDHGLVDNGEIDAFGLERIKLALDAPPKQATA